MTRSLHRADGGQQWTDHPWLFTFIAGTAVHLWLRAAGWLHSCTGSAGLRLRAVWQWATGTRAGRAFTDLAGLVAGADAGRAGGHGGLQHVAGHVHWSGALRLEHIAAQIGLLGTGRNRGLQHILGPVNNRTGGARGTVAIITCLSAAAAVVIGESLHAWLHHTHSQTSQEESDN